MPMKLEPLLPVLSLMLSAGIWGVVWYPVRFLEQGGLSASWITAISYTAAALPVLVYYGDRGLELRSRWGTLVVLALAAGWCNLSFVLALIDGRVVRVLLLFYLSPVWTVLIGRLILKEPVSSFTLFTLGLAMAGALFMLWDGVEGFPWPLSDADWLALSSGFTFSLANVMVRDLQEVSITGKTLVCWVGVVVISVLGILVLAEPLPRAGWDILLGAVALGWFGFLIATFALQYGVTRMPVQRSAVILLFELVAGGASAAWLAGEKVGGREWIGGALIILAGYAVAVKQEKE